ncbi:MAG: helix-turn-helix domain-containing protein [Nocardioides sp.]|nr:helix-turn-helix domain-containing protein [Nocardioides sp.]
MDVELVALARAVDPAVLGARVRDARVRLGLTQGQLAGDEMSTAYVSRIESGQRRPDPVLLDALATRLGVGVETLITGATRDEQSEIQLALDWAQLSVKTGDATGALTRVDDVLIQLGDRGLHDLHRRALQVKAAALEADGRLDDAIVLLEDLMETAPEDTTWVTDVIALSRCYRVSGDLTRAVDTGERALSLLKDFGLDATLETTSLVLSLAAAYFERGETGHAVRLCRRAIEQAETLGSAGAKGAAYWNASIMESRRGHAAAAVALARKALAHVELGDDQRQSATLRNLLGTFELRTDQPDLPEVLATLRRAGAELSTTDAAPSVVAFNLLAQARAHFMMGDEHEARRGVVQARGVAAQRAPLVAADTWVLLGQIEMATGNTSAAREAYRQAVLMLSAIGADKSAAQLWFELGAALEGVGDPAAALHAYRSAGASTGLRSLNSTVPADPRARVSSTQV